MIKFRKILEKAGGTGPSTGHASLHAGISEKRSHAGEAILEQSAMPPSTSSRPEASGASPSKAHRRAPEQPRQQAQPASETARTLFAEETLKGVFDELLADAGGQAAGAAGDMAATLGAANEPSTQGAAAGSDDELTRAVEQAFAEAQAMADAAPAETEGEAGGAGDAARAEGTAGADAGSEDLDGDFMAEVDRLLAQFGRVKGEEAAAPESEADEQADEQADKDVSAWLNASLTEMASQEEPGARKGEAAEEAGRDADGDADAGGADQELLDQVFASLTGAAGVAEERSEDAAQPQDAGEETFQEIESAGVAEEAAATAAENAFANDSGPSITEEEREALFATELDETGKDAGGAGGDEAFEPTESNVAEAIELETAEALEAAAPADGEAGAEVEIDFTAAAPAEASQAEEEQEEETLASTEELLGRMLSDLDKLTAMQQPHAKDEKPEARKEAGKKGPSDDDTVLSALLSQVQLGIEEPEGGELLASSKGTKDKTDKDGKGSGSAGDAADGQSGDTVDDILGKIQASMSKTVEQAQQIAADSAPVPAAVETARNDEAVRQEVLSRSKEVEQKILDEAFGVDEKTIRAELKTGLAGAAEGGRRRKTRLPRTRPPPRPLPSRRRRGNRLSRRFAAALITRSCGAHTR